MNKDPVEIVGSHLGRLRNRYIVQRLFEIITVALLADLAVDLTTITLFKLWGIRIPVPFVFEILLVLLILRDRPRWNLLKTGIRIDRQFSLKDRLYSYVWFGHRSDIPEVTRVAQATEILSCADFSGILSRTRFRIPRLFPVALSLFLGLLYLSWNSEYQPGGITTMIVQKGGGANSRTGSRTIGHEGLSVSDRSLPGESRERDTMDIYDTGKKRENLAGEAEQVRGATGSDPTGAEQQDTEAPQDQSQTPGGASGGNGAEGGQEPGSRDGERMDGSVPPPQHIDSVIRTESVSELVSPSLAKNSSFMFRELPEASKFLNLVPGQGGQTLAPLDRSVLTIFEEEASRYPEYNRKHLLVYYHELEKVGKTP